MTIPPAAVIALRDLIAKWEQEREGYVRGIQMDSPVGDMNRASANTVQRFLADLDALVARVEPQEQELTVIVREFVSAMNTWRDSEQGGYDALIGIACNAVDELQAELDRATARVEPPPQEHGWQPIETAPKDGTEIIALVSGRPYFVSWTTHGTQHAEPWWRDREAYGLTEPTHWIPLPVLAAPPSPPPQEPT